MVNMPRLTIGLPVYNGEVFVDKCINSILAQTYEDFELIVCDNASTDETRGLVEAWCRADPRIRLHRAPVNKGAAANFNWCFALGQGEYFKWCAVDDLMEPNCFRTCVEALDSRPDAVLAYPGAVDIDESGTIIGEIYDNSAQHAFGSADPARRFRDLICEGHSCISVFGVIRRSALERTSLIGPYPASDKVLLAQLGLQGPYIRVPGNLILHRQHSRRSVTENPALRDRVAWFNTAHRGPIFPHFRLLGEYLRAALFSRLSIRERLRCLPQIGRWLHWGGWRGLADDAAFYIRSSARSRAGRESA
jgi:glycosyltransferase involved in cell wall biosynthesis